MPPSPPVYGYGTTNAFGNLTFTDPVSVKAPPGETNRLFVLEQNGIIAVITNLLAPNRTVFLNIVGRVTGGVPPDEQGLLGFAFHPGYATNGYIYVYYSTNNASGTQRHQRLARFQTVANNPNAADPASELPILTMFDEASNHNGGDMHFGPDGYLYLSLGDEGGGNDQYNNSQLIDKDFWSGMLRLDVDNRPENLVPNPHPAINPGTYRVPADNPFVGVTSFQGRTLDPTKVRTEFYAIGLRNPWRFSFDPETGQIYCGDVGQNAREEVDIIVKGGNYGWAFREGFIAGPKTMPTGATRIDPILDYSHGSATNQGFSISGGVVYRGTRIPGLFGYYIFADYVSGNVFATLYSGVTPSPFTRIAVEASVTGFGVDPANGDVLLCDADDDTIKRLVAAPVSGAPLPLTLAETGAFADVPSLIPSAGFVAYDVNVPFWSDNATKSRWFYIPTNRTVTFRAAQNWSFPTGSVWIKHFELELTNGVPSSRKRLETRLLVRDNANGVYGVTYRWGNSLLDATLVPEEGLDEPLVINDGGIIRTQVWRYPGRLECLRCHTGATIGGLALGFNTPQLNKDFDYGGITDNQIRSLHNAGYFQAGAAPVFSSLRALVHGSNEDASVEQRVRSYLAANCSFCHAPGGPGLGTFDTRIFTPLSSAGLINGILQNSGSDLQNRVIVPGSTAHSMLLTRVSTRGTGQMPPVASTIVDSQAVVLIERWITNDLTNYQTFAQWQTNHFGSSILPDALMNADPDGDRGVNIQEYLSGKDPKSAASFWPIQAAQGEGSVVLSYERIANRGIELQWSTDVTNSVWTFLDNANNRPFFSQTTGVTRVVVPATNDVSVFFRGRIYEP
jgi:glucose/arabinose dehydrogenase